MIYQINKTTSPVLRVAFALFSLALFTQIPAQSSPAKVEGAARSEVLTAKFKTSDLVGQWKSEWGPVQFKQGKNGIFSGSWKEGEAKIGKISDGKFSPADAKLSFNFIETWSGLKGQAILKLSNDRQHLSGSWVRGKDKGEWTMHRPKSS